MIKFSQSSPFAKLFIWVAFLLLIVFFLEIALRVKGVKPMKMFKLSVSPPHLFEPDSLLGWRPHKGVYRIFVNDSSKTVTATLNERKNRITNAIGKQNINSCRSLIQIYGCSCTFGLSIEDTSTQSYKLQQLLPEYCVENKGVPGYGLSQMYLLLQESLLIGDTPKVVVINYGDFHDERTPLSYRWSSLIWMGITMGDGAKYNNQNLPYYTFPNGKVQLNRGIKLSKLTKFWPLVHVSSLACALNFNYITIHDDAQFAYFHRLSHLTALEIMKYCKKNGITPIFAKLTNSRDVLPTNNIQSDLEQKGYLTLDYGIDFSDNKYNCGPYDDSHPNKVAHSIYAEKLFVFLKAKKLIP